MNLRTDSVTFIAGKRRSGKSQFVKTVIWSKLTGNKVLCVFHDRKWEHYEELCSCGDTVLVHDMMSLMKADQAGHGKILYAPVSGDVEDFNELCSYLFERGNSFLVVDEAQSYANPGEMPPAYADIIRMGTVRGVGVCSLSQRPRGAHNMMISEADLIISFRLQLFTDCQKIAQVVGEEAFKLNELPPYHFMSYDGHEVRWHDPINIR